MRLIQLAHNFKTLSLILDSIFENLVIANHVTYYFYFKARQLKGIDIYHPKIPSLKSAKIYLCFTFVENPKLCLCM